MKTLLYPKNKYIWRHFTSQCQYKVSKLNAVHKWLKLQTMTTKQKDIYQILKKININCKTIGTHKKEGGGELYNTVFTITL